MKNFLTTMALMLLSYSLIAQSAFKVSTSKQKQGARFGEKNNSVAVATDGQPIGGIVVKGGKSASVPTITLVTSPSGEFTFTVTETGNYTLNFLAGENPVYEEAGHLVTNAIHDSALRADPGNPIGGIIVKGGKNPGGSFFTLQTDEKGVLELLNLTPGTYTFKVTPKVIKATNGLKDTLKTQV